LAAHLDAGLVDWTDFEEWEGSDEVYVRRLGCSRATTIEATVDWPLGERVGWYVKALRWCAGYLGQVKDGSSAGAQPGTGAPHPQP